MQSHPDRSSLVSMARTQRSELPNGPPKKPIHQDVALRLVYVIETTDGPSASRSDYPADDQYAERSLHATRLAVEATGLPVQIDTAVVCGDVDSALIDESNSATLICVGSIGIGRVASMVLGSTAAMLAE